MRKDKGHCSKRTGSWRADSRALTAVGQNTILDWHPEYIRSKVHKLKDRQLGKRALDRKIDTKCNSYVRKPKMPIRKGAEVHYNQENKTLKHRIPFYICHINNITKTTIGHLRHTGEENRMSSPTHTLQSVISQSLSTSTAQYLWSKSQSSHHFSAHILVVSLKAGGEFQTDLSRYNLYRVKFTPFQCRVLSLTNNHAVYPTP